MNTCHVWPAVDPLSVGFLGGIIIIIIFFVSIIIIIIIIVIISSAGMYHISCCHLSDQYNIMCYMCFKGVCGPTRSRCPCQGVQEGQEGQDRGGGARHSSAHSPVYHAACSCVPSGDPAEPRQPLIRIFFYFVLIIQADAL